METFENEVHRKLYENCIMRLCREKDCQVKKGHGALLFPSDCTPSCDCRQRTERAAYVAVLETYGYHH